MTQRLNFEEDKFLESNGLSVSSNDSIEEELEGLSDLPPISTLDLSPPKTAQTPNLHLPKKELQFTSANIPSHLSLGQGPISKLDLEPPSFQNIITSESVQDQKSKNNSKQPTPRILENQNEGPEAEIPEEKRRNSSSIRRLSINGESVITLPDFHGSNQEELVVKKGAKIKKSFDLDQEIIIPPSDGASQMNKRWTFSAQTMSRSPKEVFNKYTSRDPKEVIPEVDEEHLANPDSYITPDINCLDLKKQFFVEDEAEDFATWSVPGTSSRTKHFRSKSRVPTQELGPNLVSARRELSKQEVSQRAIPTQSALQNSTPKIPSNIEFTSALPEKSERHSPKNFESTQSIPKYLYLKQPSVQPPPSHNIFLQQTSPEATQVQTTQPATSPTNQYQYESQSQPRFSTFHAPSNLFKIKRALGLVREMCSGLSSEDTYMKLKMMREEELEINEYLVVKVYEMIRPYLRDYQSAKRANREVQGQVNERNQKLEKVMDEGEKQRVEFRRREDSFRRELESLHLEIQVKNSQVEVLKKEGLVKENQILILGSCAAQK